MRILVLTFYYEPDLCAGSFRATAFVKELRKKTSKNDRIDIITTMPNRYSSYMDSALKIENDDNTHINRISLGAHKNGFLDQSFLFFKFSFEVINLIRKRERYDIIYATSSRLMTAFLGALISNRQKNKLFLDLRDIFTDTLDSIFVDSKYKYFIPILKKIEKYTIDSANHINLVSRGFEDYFLNLNNKINYSFYYNGIDDVFLKYNFSKEKNKYPKIITYAGNIGEGQGLEKIIPQMALKLGSDYEIHIVGDGGTKKKLLNELSNIGNVKVFDPVNRKKLLEIYKDSDFLFLHLNNYPAFEKVLPSKIFEYAATNKFLIAGVGGFSKDFILNNINNSIVFEPCNVDDFIRQFKKIKIKSSINRKKFIDEFSRKNIMFALSDEVYKL